MNRRKGMKWMRRRSVREANHGRSAGFRSPKALHGKSVGCMWGWGAVWWSSGGGGGGCGKGASRGGVKQVCARCDPSTPFHLCPRFPGPSQAVPHLPPVSTLPGLPPMPFLHSPFPPSTTTIHASHRLPSLSSGFIFTHQPAPTSAPHRWQAPTTSLRHPHPPTLPVPPAVILLTFSQRPLS